MFRFVAKKHLAYDGFHLPQAAVFTKINTLEAGVGNIEPLMEPIEHLHVGNQRVYHHICKKVIIPSFEQQALRRFS